MTKIQNYIRSKNNTGCLSACFETLQRTFGKLLPLFLNQGRPKCSIFRFAALNTLTILISVVLLLCSCKQKTPDQLQTINALQQMQDLATVEYTVTKVVKANDNKTWYKWGERKILFTCEANIKAGIDLSQLKEENIHISGKNIRIQLPAPKILTVNMPPENIKVAYSDVGVLRSEFSAQEKNALMVQAEKQIWEAGKQSGIIEQAKLNTQTFMLQWLKQMGFENIELTYDGANNKLQNRSG